MRKPILILGLVVCLAAAVFAAGGQEGATATQAPARTVTLRMGLITAENHPVTQASRRFAELVKERTKGAYEIQVIAGGSLGGEIEMHDMIASGTLDLGCFGSGVPASYNPEFQLLLMPFLWESPEQMIGFSKSDIQKGMNEKYTAKSGVRILASNWDMGLRHTISKKPIASIGDFKGLKIRVPQLPAWVDMFKLLGAIPASLPFTEVYTALQQGVVDAAESPLNLMLSNSFYEQAKTIVLTGHIMYYNMVYITDALYQKMSPEVQKIFRDAAAEAGDFETSVTRSDDAGVRQKLEENGVKFVSVSRGEISRMMAPLYDKWEDQYGAEIRRKVDEFKKSF